MYKYYSKYFVLPPGITKKMVLVMKLTTLIMLMAFMQVSANTFAQKVSLSDVNTPLNVVFDQISAQTGFDFAYTGTILHIAKPVTIQVKNEELADVLAKIFDGQPLEYSIKDRSVVVSIREVSFPDKVKAALNLDKIDVSGKVTDENGQALPGATIRLKNGSAGTVSDVNGAFVLKSVSEKATIVISFIGYVPKELYAANDIGTIRLEKSSSKLDEVQVIAYGTTSQRLNTGDVSVVSAKTIAAQPVSNPLLALEGQVPGLFITQATGLPGSGVTVRIRGQNSMANGNDPLYVIDGVPYTSQLLTNYGGILGNSGVAGQQSGNPLSFINPADIESISVLKDAGATAIYGSRGANGVILITTKKGKAGATKVDVNVQNGYGEVARTADLLSTQQYLEMRREALKNDGITPSLANGDYDLLQWNTNSYTNWQKVLLGNTAHYTDAEGTISGGTENTQFLVGTGYQRQTTVFPGDFADQKGSLHFNLNNTSPNKKFNMSLTGSYMFDNNHLPASDLTSNALKLAPDAPSLYKPDGSINWGVNNAGAATFWNPIAQNLNTYQNKTSNLLTNMVLGYELLPGLILKSSFGYTNLQTNELSFIYSESVPPQYLAYFQPEAIYFNNNINSWIIEPQLSYQKIIAKGKLDFLLGSTIEQQDSNGYGLMGVGYNNEQLMSNISSATNIYALNSEQSIYKYNALFGRVNYNWDDTYLIDLTARRDGSSRFGAANEFHDFGAAGIGWVFSKTSFIKAELPFLSFGKLRASYGTTGNDQIGDYNYLSLYSSSYESIPYQGLRGLQPNGLANPYLEWELTKKTELALETGFLKDRILLTVSYSVNRSSNQLLFQPLPPTDGFGGISVNLPATVQNTNLEFSVNTTNIKGTDFKWTSSFNLTIPHNKLIAFPDLASSAYASQYIIGQPVSILRLYHFEGVNATTGQYQFASSTDKFNPQYGVDNTAVVNTLPKLYGGFQNSFSYRRLRLDFLFQFVKQIGRNALFASPTAPGAFSSGNGNQFVSVLNRWQAPGDVTTTQFFSSNGSVNNQYWDAISSDAAYSDDSYIRLKNLSLSLQLNDNWIKAVKLRDARLFVQGQNLLTFTHYQGLDPENLSTSSLPPLRILTLGIQLGL